MNLFLLVGVLKLEEWSRAAITQLTHKQLTLDSSVKAIKTKL